jgi:hypothetical protein
MENWFNVSMLRHARKQSRKIHSRVTSEGQRMPKSPVDFDEDGRSAFAASELDHRYSMPLQGSQNSERGSTNLWLRSNAYPHRASGAGRVDVADPAMCKFRSQFPVPHQSEVSSTLAFHVLLDEHGGGSLHHIPICGTKFFRIAGITRPPGVAQFVFRGQFFGGAWLEDNGILDEARYFLCLFTAAHKSGLGHGDPQRSS